MEQRLSVITLGVSDLARSRRFYEEGLGWQRGGGEDDVAFYQAGALVVSLYEWSKLAIDAHVPDEGSGFRGISLGYCTRSRDEVDTLVARAESAGAKVVVAPHETFWGGYGAYFADPDAHLWEIAWNPFWVVTPEGATLMKA